MPAEHHPVGRPLELGGAADGRDRPRADRLGQGRQGVEQRQRRAQLAPGEAARLAELGHRPVDHRRAGRRQRGAGAGGPGQALVQAEGGHQGLGGRGPTRQLGWAGGAHAGAG